MYTNEALGKALEDLTAAYNNFITEAKDAAIAAMNDTTVAQLKEDARGFIAGELKTQKEALEKAIPEAVEALKKAGFEAGVKLDEKTERLKKELTDLLAAAENALDEKIPELKKEYKEAAAEAVKDLDKKGESLIMTVKKEITEKITAELDALKEMFFFADAKEHIRIESDNPKSFHISMRVQSLRGAPIKTIHRREHTPNLPEAAPTEFLNGSTFFLNENRLSNLTRTIILEGNTIKSFFLYARDVRALAYIAIENFRFLEKIYTVGHQDLINYFQIKNCPRFSGFKHIDAQKMNWLSPFYPEWLGEG